MTQNQKLEATFSTLVLSIGSSAAMALGLAPHPQTGKTEVDKDVARMNIDLLIMLQTKTMGHLTDDEKKFLDSVINDLQMRFVQK